MPFSLEKLDLENKPYNKCIVCKHLGVRCDGPNFLAMTPERRAEWINLRRLYLGWTMEELAEKANISIVTLSRAVNHAMDMKISSLEAIVKVLVNGSWGRFPCALESIQDEESEWITKCRATETQLEAEQRKVDFLRDQITFKDQQLVEKDRQIASKDERLAERRDFIYRKDKIILTLSILLGICLLIIITALIIDRLNHDIGFFWLSEAMRTGNDAWSNIAGLI